MRPVALLSLFSAACLPSLCTTSFASPPAGGNSFRVENRVTAEGSREPVSRSTTVFLDGLVYDMMQEPAETIIYDKAQRRFLLLDLRRRVQTEVAATEVTAFTRALQQRAEQQRDPFVKFLAAPRFEEQFDATSGELTLRSAWMSYRVETAPAPSQAISTEYREFSDALARLNTFLSPGARPPLPRLALNEALHRRGLVARKVVLTMPARSDPAAKRTAITSEHDWTPTLSDADRSRVAEVRQMLTDFRKIGFEQYRKQSKR